MKNLLFSFVLFLPLLVCASNPYEKPKQSFSKSTENFFVVNYLEINKNVTVLLNDDCKKDHAAALKQASSFFTVMVKSIYDLGPEYYGFMDDAFEMLENAVWAADHQLMLCTKYGSK